MGRSLLQVLDRFSTATKTVLYLKPSWRLRHLLILDPSILELGGHSSYTTGIAGYYRRKFDEHQVKIHNIRGHEDEFDLNTQGFQFGKHPTVEKDFDDVDRIKRVVYPETEELLKEVSA